jgi:hypothetical protein
MAALNSARGMSRTTWASRVLLTIRAGAGVGRDLPVDSKQSQQHQAQSVGFAGTKRHDAVDFLAACHSVVEKTVYSRKDRLNTARDFGPVVNALHYCDERSVSVIGLRIQNLRT